MGISNQMLPPPSTGTMTAPNGRTFNTNPANNAFMAGAANAAKTGYNGLTGNDAAQAWMKANPMGSASLPTTAPSPQGAAQRNGEYININNFEPQGPRPTMTPAQQQAQEQAMMQAKMQADLAQRQGPTGIPPSPQGMGQYNLTSAAAANPEIQKLLARNPASLPAGYTPGQEFQSRLPSQQNTPPSPQNAAGGKGGQALPSPQALGQGLQRQQAMQNTMQAGKGGQQMPQPNAPRPGQMPMSMQRQPQGGFGGRSMPQQFPRR